MKASHFSETTGGDMSPMSPPRYARGGCHNREKIKFFLAPESVCQTGWLSPSAKT